VIKVEGGKGKTSEPAAPIEKGTLNRTRTLNVSKKNDGVVIVDLLDADSNDDVPDADEDDDVVFVSERPVKKPEGACEPRVKTEK
jgi:hypothetical protein